MGDSDRVLSDLLLGRPGSCRIGQIHGQMEQKMTESGFHLFSSSLLDIFVLLLFRFLCCSLICFSFEVKAYSTADMIFLKECLYTELLYCADLRVSMFEPNSYIGNKFTEVLLYCSRNGISLKY